MRGVGPVPVRGVALFGAIAAFVLTASAGDASLRERLAAASPERGEKVFRACRACHSVAEGAAHTIGPNLWGVVGRRVAAADGYDRYTPAMASLAGAWSPERLDRYLHQPVTEVEGTAMIFPGIPDAADRADLIAWLNLNSPSPLVLAPGRATAQAAPGTQGAGGTQSAGAPPQGGRPSRLGVLVAGEGAEETYAYCTTCHSGRIVAQQGLTRPDWEELLEEMVEENGMNPIGEPDLGRVLDYLAANYGPDRPNLPGR